jgi:twitching motility protein PilT
MPNTWYLQNNGDLDHCYRIPGRSLEDDEREDALHLLHVAQVESLNLGPSAAYRVDTVLPSSGNRVIARGQAIETTGERYHVLREIADIVPQLGDKRWNYPLGLQKLLLAPSLGLGGLILVSGSGGSGKSTTAAATMVSRLRVFGSVAFTVENPPEYFLNGLHGKGVCFQFAIREEDDFRIKILDALRGYPAGTENSILMIGEIRTPEVAALAIESGLSGHLVITNVHGMSIETSLARIESLAGQVTGKETSRRDLAECFRLALHQRLVRKQNDIIDYMSTVLVSNGQDSVSSKIRDGQYHSLSAEISQQNTLLVRTGSPYFSEN